MILLAGSDACLERFNVLPSSTAGRPTKSVQLLILLPPISDYWPPPHKEGELERQPRWLYFTPFSLPYTQGCLHTHIICLLVFIYAHTDKHAAAWTLKIRSRSCEERGGGVALMKYACMCLCLFVSVCFSFFWGGGVLLYRTSWEWRAFQTGDRLRTTSSHIQGKQLKNKHLIAKPPNGYRTADDRH